MCYEGEKWKIEKLSYPCAIQSRKVGKVSRHALWSKDWVTDPMFPWKGVLGFVCVCVVFCCCFLLYLHFCSSHCIYLKERSRDFFFPIYWLSLQTPTTAKANIHRQEYSILGLPCGKAASQSAHERVFKSGRAGARPRRSWMGCQCPCGIGSTTPNTSSLGNVGCVFVLFCFVFTVSPFS